MSLSLIRELPKHLAANLRGIAILALAGSLAWSTSQLVHGWRASFARRHDVYTFDTAGTAKRHLSPVQITWTLDVEAHAATRAAALHEMQRKSDGLYDFLSAHGNAADLTLELPTVQEATQTVSVHRADGSEESVDKPDGFNASRQLVIRSADVERVLRTVRALTLNDDIAMLAESSIHACTFGDTDALRTQLIGEARANLRGEVERTLAQLGHARLGRLVHADLGGFSTNEGASSCEDGTFATATVTAMYELD